MSSTVEYVKNTEPQYLFDTWSLEKFRDFETGLENQVDGDEFEMYLFGTPLLQDMYLQSCYGLEGTPCELNRSQIIFSMKI